jgi:hypothetical protein
VIPRRPRPLCAICADREATTITDWECESGATRTIVACWPCLSPVPDPPEEYEPADIAARVRDRATTPATRGAHTMRDAVLQAVRTLGAASTEEIRAELNMATRAEQNHVTVVLSRLVRAGALTAEEIVHGNPSIGRIYRPTGERPVTPTMAGHFAVLADAPEEFEPSTIGLSPAVLGDLRRDGYVEQVRRSRQTRVGGVSRQLPSVWRRTSKPLPHRSTSHAA